MAGAFKNFGRRLARQLLRLVPGSAALAIKRDLRDAAWLDEADAVIVSYPKSGRTFVRAMLARLYQRKFGIDERNLLEFPMLRNAPAGAPRVLLTHAGDTMRSPDKITVDAKSYAGKKVVLISRHPGDIAVSRFFHLKHRSRDRARRKLAELPLGEFVWSDHGGIPSIVRFLNLFSAMPGVTIIRYEDFLASPETALAQLAKAIGLDVSADDIADAVAFGSIDNLKQLEREGYFRSSRLRASSRNDARSTKVRSGKSGGYRDALDAEVAERIDAYVEDELDPAFGYGSGAGAGK